MWQTHSQKKCNINLETVDTAGLLYCKLEEYSKSTYLEALAKNYPETTRNTLLTNTSQNQQAWNA